MRNFFFRPGMTVAARIPVSQVPSVQENVVLTDLRPVGVCGSGIIIAGDYKDETYYQTLNPLMTTFLFTENADRDKSLVQHMLWSEEPSECL